MKKNPKPRRVDSDIKVLGSGWWCPSMESVFKQQCSHSAHHPSQSVRCIVVTKEPRTISDKERLDFISKNPRYAHHWRGREWLARLGGFEHRSEETVTTRPPKEAVALALAWAKSMVPGSSPEVDVLASALRTSTDIGNAAHERIHELEARIDGLKAFGAWDADGNWKPSEDKAEVECLRSELAEVRAKLDESGAAMASWRERCGPWFPWDSSARKRLADAEAGVKELESAPSPISDAREAVLKEAADVVKRAGRRPDGTAWADLNINDLAAKVAAPARLASLEGK